MTSIWAKRPQKDARPPKAHTDARPRFAQRLPGWTPESLHARAAVYMRKHYRRTSSDPSAKAQRTQTYTNYKERAGGKSKSRRCQPASTAIQAVQRQKSAFEHFGCDVCDASLYKNSIVPASRDTITLTYI